jgi:hypothetical protein
MAASVLLRDMRRGVLAGLIGSTIQVGIGFLVSRFFLPEGEDNNIAPRLAQQSLASLGQPPNPPRDWLLGTLFHYGYGAGWGIVLARGRTLARLPALLVAFPVSLMIYLVAFSRVGAGTVLKAEQDPAQRPREKQESLFSVVAAFTISTALLLDSRGRRGEQVTARALRHTRRQDAAGPDYWL